MCFLSGLSFAFPKNKVYQSEIKHLSAKLFSSKINFKNMEKIYENSGVKSRFLVNELEWYLDEHNWNERNALFRKNSIDLLKKSISETFDKIPIRTEDVGAIIFINTTGISTPSIDAEIFNLFAFNNNVKRLPIFGYGCAGGVLGLNRAVEIYKSCRKPVLVCNVELCSLTFRPQIFSKANIISTALFADASSSYVISGEKSNCKITNSFEYTWNDSLELMGWGVENDGLSVIFDKGIPKFITDNMLNIINEFSTKPKDGYILHSGGMKIIDAYKKIFGNHKTIEIASNVLSQYGNVSSVSVLLSLREILQNELIGNFLMSALGPGFTAGLSEVEIYG